MFESEKGYSVKADSLVVNQHFWIEDVEGGLPGEYTEFICKSPVSDGLDGMLEIMAFSIRDNMDRVIRVNPRQQREIFVQKLGTGWQQI